MYSQSVKTKESKFISIVVYVHNDGNRIPEFFGKVLPVLKEGFERYEIICVNDASVDDSVEILRTYFGQSGDAGNGNMIQIIHMSCFQGIEASMNAGRDMAIGDFVYEFDNMDCDYPVEYIRQVYGRLLEGYDVVAAGRKKHHRGTSELFYFLYNMTSRSGNRIGQETFRILSRRAINRVMSMGKYIPYRKAVYRNCGLKTDTLYYEPEGSSRHRKKNHRERAGLALDSFIYFTNGMESLSLILSVVFLLVSLCTGLYIVGSVFSESRPVEGWMSMMGFLSAGFFGVFSLLTIMLKYLSVMLNLIFKYQRYLVESVEKITGNS